MFIRRCKRCRLWGWLDDEVKVDLPVVSKSVVGVVTDLPSARVAGCFGVTAADTDVDVLERHVSQSVVLRQFMKVFHFSRCLMIRFRSLIVARRICSRTR